MLRTVVWLGLMNREGGLWEFERDGGLCVGGVERSMEVVNEIMKVGLGVVARRVRIYPPLVVTCTPLSTASTATLRS